MLSTGNRKFQGDWPWGRQDRAGLSQKGGRSSAGVREVIPAEATARIPEKQKLRVRDTLISQTTLYKSYESRRGKVTGLGQGVEVNSTGTICLQEAGEDGAPDGAVAA